jgi:hypothetical protein
VDRISSRELAGKWALVACIGALLSVCLLASLDWRGPIDYRGSAKTRAFEANARHDSRYLESRSRPLLRPLLPPGLDFDPSETLQLGRDIRLVPAAGDDADAARLQNDYLMQYNGEIWRLRAQAGYPRRPTPLSKPMTMTLCALAMLPLMVNLYIRYRLGPYRLDGKSWTVSLTRETYTYFMRKTYSSDATGWLYALWLSMILLAPWGFLIAWKFGYGHPAL